MARRRSAVCSSDARRGRTDRCGDLMDEDEDAEEKRRRMEAKIAAENFGAAIGFAAGAAMAVKEKLDEQSAREEQKKQQHEQAMGGL